MIHQACRLLRQKIGRHPQVTLPATLFWSMISSMTEKGLAEQFTGIWITPASMEQWV